MFLAVHGDALVLWVHVLAACVWIGGQITLGLLVPVLRGQPVLIRRAARRFQIVAWAAFAVLLLTGVANMHNAGISGSDLTGDPRGRTLFLKLVFVAISGLAAALHAFIVGPRAGQFPARTTRALSGILGGLALLAAVVAALYGVVIGAG